MRNSGESTKTKDAAERDQTVDVGRGIAIILVVIGHALIGLNAAENGHWTSNFLLISIYSTHMAFFFALSGLFSSSLVQRTWPDFLYGLWVRIVWPYILWGLIILIIHYEMSAYTNVALAAFDPIRILWVPPAVLWFLYALFLAMLILRLCAPLPAMIVVILGVVFVLLPYVHAVVPDKLRFIGLVLLSAKLGRSRLYLFQSNAVVWISIFVMVATLFRAYQISGEPMSSYPAFAPEFIPAMVAGPVLLLWLSRSIAMAGWGKAFSYIGQRTMPIFVTHILITASSRIGLRELGITDWVFIAVVASILGVLLPLLADRIAARLHLRPILGWR